jgi:hypothetical protein
MYLRACGSIKSKNHKKDWVRNSQSRTVPDLLKVRKSNEIIWVWKFADLRFAEPIRGPPTFVKKTTACFLQADPGWAEDWKDPLFHILRDIAEPSGVDPHYTLTRYIYHEESYRAGGQCWHHKFFNQSQM